MTTELIPAGVLIPLLVDPQASDQSAFELKTSEGWSPLPASTEVLLTVRTQTVEHHKGQISFPGGAFEKGDDSLRRTALRESHEEIGLEPHLVEVVGELPEVPTVATRFTVKPYIGLIRSRPEFRPNPEEISQILIVPLRHLLDPANSILESFERNGLRLQIRTYYYDSHRIWGATGRMLQTLLENHLRTR